MMSDEDSKMRKQISNARKLISAMGVSMQQDGLGALRTKLSSCAYCRLGFSSQDALDRARKVCANLHVVHEGCIEVMLRDKTRASRCPHLRCSAPYAGPPPPPPEKPSILDSAAAEAFGLKGVAKETGMEAAAPERAVPPEISGNDALASIRLSDRVSYKKELSRGSYGQALKVEERGAENSYKDVFVTVMNIYDKTRDFEVKEGEVQRKPPAILFSRDRLGQKHVEHSLIRLKDDIFPGHDEKKTVSFRLIALDEPTREKAGLTTYVQASEGLKSPYGNPHPLLLYVEMVLFSEGGATRQVYYGTMLALEPTLKIAVSVSLQLLARVARERANVGLPVEAGFADRAETAMRGIAGIEDEAVAEEEAGKIAGMIDTLGQTVAAVFGPDTFFVVSKKWTRFPSSMHGRGGRTLVEKVLRVVKFSAEGSFDSARGQRGAGLMPDVLAEGLFGRWATHRCSVGYDSVHLGRVTRGTLGLPSELVEGAPGRRAAGFKMPIATPGSLDKAGAHVRSLIYQIVKDAPSNENLLMYQEVYEENDKKAMTAAQKLLGERLGKRLFAANFGARRAFWYTSTMRMVYEMLCAIGYLHSNGIAHLDIKPGNFLVFADAPILPTTAWTRLRVCVSDYGFARFLESGYTPHTVVTRDFADPYIVAASDLDPKITPKVATERVVGATALAHDAWALGLTLFEFVFGSNIAVPWNRNKKNKDGGGLKESLQRAGMKLSNFFAAAFDLRDGAAMPHVAAMAHLAITPKASEAASFIPRKSGVPDKPEGVEDDETARLKRFAGRLGSILYDERIHCDKDKRKEQRDVYETTMKALLDEKILGDYGMDAAFLEGNARTLIAIIDGLTEWDYSTRMTVLDAIKLMKTSPWWTNLDVDARTQLEDDVPYAPTFVYGREYGGSLVAAMIERSREHAVKRSREAGVAVAPELAEYLDEDPLDSLINQTRFKSKAFSWVFQMLLDAASGVPEAQLGAESNGQWVMPDIKKCATAACALSAFKMSYLNTRLIDSLLVKAEPDYYADSLAFCEEMARRVVSDSLYDYQGLSEEQRRFIAQAKIVELEARLLEHCGWLAFDPLGLAAMREGLLPAGPAAQPNDAAGETEPEQQQAAYAGDASSFELPPVLERASATPELFPSAIAQVEAAAPDEEVVMDSLRAP
jgi:serine/threonine protein kinase